MHNKLNRVIALSWLIILDGLRRHALIALILFALIATTGGLLFFDFIPRDIGRASNDFLFSISWLTGLIFLLFHAVQVMAWSDERRILHTFLARPISRTEYALAIFLGLAALLLALNIILSSLGWLLLNLIRNSVTAENYFQNLSLNYYILSAIGLFSIQLTILAVILLFSATVRGSFPVLLMTLSYYFICSGLPVVREALKQKEFAISGTPFLPALKSLTALFPNFSQIDFKIFVTSSNQTMTATQIALPFLQIYSYILITIFIACFIYNHRDLQ